MVTTRHQALRPVEDLARLVKGDPRLLNRALQRLDDVQIALQIDNLSSEGQDTVLQAVAVDRRATVLGFTRYETAADVLRRLAPEEAAAIIDEFESDDAADVLQEMDAGQLRAILQRLDPEGIQEIEDLLTYDPNSAGGIMNTEAVRVHDEVTVGEIRRIVQETPNLPDHVFYVYVVDEDERLVGLVRLRELVVSVSDTPVREVMQTELVSVTPDTDQEEVADLASRYDVVALPVVDAQRRLLGVVTIDDIVDVLREEATEDILKMAGAGEALSDTRDFMASFRARFPWLLGAAVGGLLVATSLAGFDDALRAVPALALFMPVVAGMGGNVGTQSSTVVVRGLAVGYVERSQLFRLILREVALGASLGLISGVFIGTVALFLGIDAPDPVLLGVVITGGLVGSMSIAALVGTSVPLLLERFNVDPAVATGPFVTTAVDVLGLLFYFLLASWLLGVAS